MIKDARATCTIEKLAAVVWFTDHNKHFVNMPSEGQNEAAVSVPNVDACHILLQLAS